MEKKKGIQGAKMEKSSRFSDYPQVPQATGTFEVFVCMSVSLEYVALRKAGN